MHSSSKAWSGLWLLCLLLCVAGCGYLSSGVWDDDPGNWKKAFRSRKPDDVVVVHSRFWRAPHWTYEAGYLFELTAPAAFRQRLVAENRLVRVEGVAAEESRRLCFGECPAWFAPKPVAAYEVWSYADHPKSNFRVLIDRETGTIFMTDFQI